jgi:hypothetical protein
MNHPLGNSGEPCSERLLQFCHSSRSTGEEHRFGFASHQSSDGRLPGTHFLLANT